jgi:hypothetical protein
MRANCSHVVSATTGQEASDEPRPTSSSRHPVLAIEQRAALGISAVAWHEAQKIMGAPDATVVIAAIPQEGEAIGILGAKREPAALFYARDPRVAASTSISKPSSPSSGADVAAAPT